MHWIGFFGVCTLFMASTAMGQQQAPPTLQFSNGLWFDGTQFESRTMYSRNGKLSRERPDTVGRVVDVDGGYVVPPLCEAHNHDLGGDEPQRAIINRYLEAGIYYVAILSNLPRQTGMVRHYFNRPDSVDVQFANGGFTAPEAHPIPLRERLLGYGAYPGFTRETLADHAYFAVGTTEDLNRVWPIALSYRPDFIKIFIMNSEDHDAPPEETVYDGDVGPHPELVRELVERSHVHGLRVFAHIDTAHDFHLAIDAGVDVIAHLPGRRSPERIAPEDARRAVERGIEIITTASLVTRLREAEPERYAEIRDAQIENLRLLRDVGATLAIGSDLYEANSRIEAEYMRETGVFSAVQLLDMWTENCAATVFPNRKIGALKEQYDASFLVLDANPLEDWSALDAIRLRIKDGHILELHRRAKEGE